jgi:hypothetical protein
LTVSEAARFAHVSEEAIRRRIRAGTLTAFKRLAGGRWAIPRFGSEGLLAPELLAAAEAATNAASATAEATP